MTHTAKHTPGPWRKGVDNSIYQAETNKRIADIYMHIVYRDSDMQACANAHLIAAAPAMYEALVELVAYLRDHVEDQVLDNWAPVLKAAGALVQAEGKH